MKKSFIFLIVFLVFLNFSYFFSSKVSASVFFQDNFDSENASKWTTIGSSGWNLLGGQYGIYLHPGLSNTIPVDSMWNTNWKDIIYEVDLIEKQGVDKNILIKFKDTSNFIELHANDHGIVLEKASNSGGAGILASSTMILNNNIKYHFKFEIKNNNSIKVFINNSLLFNVIETYPIINWKIGLRAGTGGTPVVEVYFDNVVVRSLDDLDPIVLLPGMGGSWNYPSMLLGLERPQSEWFIDSWRQSL